MKEAVNILFILFILVIKHIFSPNWFTAGKKDVDDGSGDHIDIPKRTTHARGKAKREILSQLPFKL